MRIIDGITAMNLLPAQSVPTAKLASVLAEFERPIRSIAAIERVMRALIAVELDKLPRPGHGKTYQRWQVLSQIGGFDLSLAKLFEGHVDALAILTELNALYEDTRGTIWAVWAAEQPNARVMLSEISGSSCKISGKKAWCSGASIVDHALMSVWSADGKSRLVRVALQQSRINVETDGWNAIGMSATQSVGVTFNNAVAQLVGNPGDYTCRPGFWHGGAGIAAVWYGAAVEIARVLSQSSRASDDVHACAHLGAIDISLHATRALLIETAEWIDNYPAKDAATPALRVRASAEHSAQEALSRTGRALGPGPMCSNSVHAQRCADLPVFLRQSHAEHDLMMIGKAVAQECSPWQL